MIEDYSPLWISIKTSFYATIMTFVFGIVIAWFVTIYSKKSKGLIDGILTLPIILPPTVVGFFLLLIFGKKSGIGKFLENYNISIIFSWFSTVIAAFVVSFPLMYKTTRGSFEQIDENIINVARLLGASEIKIFLKIGIPIAWPGIAAGIVLSFARALGEFGATLMIAGNIPGRTQTIPIAIFFATEAGEMNKAYLWVIIIFSISLFFIVLINYWTQYEKKIVSITRRKI